jgi:hypothetical protein
MTLLEWCLKLKRRCLDQVAAELDEPTWIMGVGHVLRRQIKIRDELGARRNFLPTQALAPPSSQHPPSCAAKSVQAIGRHFLASRSCAARTTKGSLSVAIAYLRANSMLESSFTFRHDPSSKVAENRTSAFCSCARTRRTSTASEGIRALSRFAKAAASLSRTPGLGFSICPRS